MLCCGWYILVQCRINVCMFAGNAAEGKRVCLSRWHNRVQISKALLSGATQTRSVLLLSIAAVLQLLCNTQHEPYYMVMCAGSCTCLQQLRHIASDWKLRQ